MKRSLKDNLKLLIYCIVICVLLFLLVFSIYQSNKTLKSEPLNNVNEEKIIIDKKDEQNSSDVDLNYYRKKHNNNDIIARLEIPDLLNIMIVKYKDNEYYLNHSIEKKKDVRGTEFMDYRVNGDSKQINIYGHNSRTYNLPFRKLEKYLDEKFFNEHNMIYLQTDKRTRKYEIFSIKEIKTDFEHMNIDISKKEFAKHIEKLKKDSIYETNIDYNNESNILVLQTCSYNNKDSYYIISAIER